jgi:hypothetical protein
MARQFAMLIREWAMVEACGVCRGKDGKLYFYWHIVDESSVKRCIDSGQKLICELDSVVSTLGQRFDTYPDCLPSWKHEEFLKEWRDKVENPELADLYLHNHHY